ncbi:MAG: hypothetical protein HY040_20635 [Planctomycetes bacterium]|nr:hypothetical protein [Planctomycetota bacterium]
MADAAQHMLSFRDLAERHVLGAIRRQHGVRLQALRKAISYLRQIIRSDHPLSDQQMMTDGDDLFIERYGATPKEIGGIAPVRGAQSLESRKFN